MFEFGVVSEVFGIDRTDDGVPVVRLQGVRTKPGEPLRTQQSLRGDRAVRAGRARGRRPGRRAGDDLAREYRRSASSTRCARPRPRGRDPADGVLGRVRARRGRVCWTDGRARRTGATSTSCASSSRWPSSTRTCCSSTTATSSPAPAPRPASTPACTWSAASSAARSRPGSPAGWWSRRSATAASGSTSSVPVPECAGDELRRCWTGWSRTCRRAHRARTGPAGPDVGADLRPPVRRRDRDDAGTGGSPRSASCAPAALLEHTDLGIDQIAAESGFGSGALLRHHFRRVVGVPPGDYRRTFATVAG